MKETGSDATTAAATTAAATTAAATTATFGSLMPSQEITEMNLTAGSKQSKSEEANRLLRSSPEQQESKKTKQGKKRRWTREERRKRQREKKTQSEASGSDSDEEKEAPKKRRPRVDKPAPKSLSERLLECAIQTNHTQGVLVHTVNGSSSSSSSVSVITSSSIPVSLNNQNATTTMTTTTTTMIHVKPLLILDLNGILCHRIRTNRTEAHEGYDYRPHPPTRISLTRVVPRHDLQGFFNLVSTHFTLAVWTSAKAKTAQQLVERLIPSSIQNKLLFLWSQQHCERQKPVANENDNDNKNCNNNNNNNNNNNDDGDNNEIGDAVDGPVFIKSLTKVYNQFPLWNASNTILMDDSPEKCPQHSNTLHPPALHGKDVQHDLPLKSDEHNEALQQEFFARLVQHYSIPRVTTTCTVDGLKEEGTQKETKQGLMNFLKQNGTEHMGWRGL